MRFTLHDVGHGFCAHLYHENGNVLLWDCGHKSVPERRPSLLREAGIHTIHSLVITNYDEDHISDLPGLRQSLSIQTLARNRSISPIQLKTLKLLTGPISRAMEVLLDMMDTYVYDVASEPLFPNVVWTRFYNNYSTDFLDTNNISLVSFLFSPCVNAIIPGDLETAGWEKLLLNPSFRDHLSRVNVFMASHHGRESGYCQRVFDYCRPSVIVFSDSEIAHASQDMTQIYERHASGVQYNGITRYVLTTRKDGSLVWSS